MYILERKGLYPTNSRDNVVGTVLLYKQNVTHMAEVSLRNICIYDYLRLLTI